MQNLRRIARWRPATLSSQRGVKGEPFYRQSKSWALLRFLSDLRALSGTLSPPLAYGSRSPEEQGSVFEVQRRTFTFATGLLAARQLASSDLTRLSRTFLSMTFFGSLNLIRTCPFNVVVE